MKNPIWLFPGFLGDENHWGDFPETLCLNLGVNVEVFNWFNVVQGASSLSEAGRFLASRAYSEGLRPVLVGYSMGGRIALQAAIEAPGAFSCVVAISSHPGFKTENDKAKRQSEDLVWSKLLQEDFDMFWEKWNARGPLQNSQIPPRPQLTSDDRRGWKQVLETMGTGTQEFFPEKLQQLPIPISIVVGANDSAYLKHLEDFPDTAEKSVINNSGHRIPLEAPQELAQVIAPFILKSQDIL